MHTPWLSPANPILKDRVRRRGCECLTGVIRHGHAALENFLTFATVNLNPSFSSIGTAKMERKSRTSTFAVLLLLARLSSSLVIERQDVNLTALPNAASIVDTLQYTTNCTAASLWHNNLPWDTAGLVTGAGSGSSSINIDFLRSALPSGYQNASDAAIADFYNDMSTGPLFSLGWLGTAVDDVEAVCLAPVDEQKYTLDRLDPSQNCTVTAKFLSDLGWLAGAQTYNPSVSANDSSWLDFIYYALPPAEQANITDVELDAYYDHISVLSTSSNNNNSDIQGFLQRAYNDCLPMMCQVQGYTGNPDIGGIGVSTTTRFSSKTNISGPRGLHR